MEGIFVLIFQNLNKEDKVVVADVLNVVKKVIFQGNALKMEELVIKVVIEVAMEVVVEVEDKEEIPELI